MVRVIVKQKVRGNKADNFQAVNYELEYSSPFPPTTGMGIRTGLTTFSVTIIAVQYIITEDLYVCYTEPLLLGPQDEPLAKVMADFEHSGYAQVAGS